METGLFEHEIDTKDLIQSRVCFFSNCIEKNQKQTHFEEGPSESPPPFGAFLKIHEFWRNPPFLTEPYPTLEVIKSSVR